MFKRLLPLAGIATVASLALAASAVAGAGGVGGGGGGGFPRDPGQYHFEDSSAAANFTYFTPAVDGGPKPGPNFVFVNASHGIFLFDPDEDSFGDPVEQESTVLTLSISGPQGGFGCFIIPDEHLSISDDLKSAALKVLVTKDTPRCPKGRMIGSHSAGMPGNEAGILGGGGGELPLPIAVAVTWNARVVWTNTHQSTSECLSYSTESRGHSRRANARAQGSISIIGDQQLQGSGSISQGANDETVSGHLPVACVSNP
jgi:hypothetical protein